MMRASIFLGLAVALGACGAAEAQKIYTCRDRIGRAITSDRPIPECADRAMRELNPSGTVSREIPAPLTPEQMHQKEIDDRKKKLADEAAREQRRRDQALLAAYSSEDKIEAARHRALTDTEALIKSSQDHAVELKKERKTIAQEVEFYKGKPLPPLIKRKVNDNEAAIADEEATLTQRSVDLDRINQRYDEETKRYRELMGVAKATQK